MCANGSETCASLKTSANLQARKDFSLRLGSVQFAACTGGPYSLQVARGAKDTCRMYKNTAKLPNELNRLSDENSPHPPPPPRHAPLRAHAAPTPRAEARPQLRRAGVDTSGSSSGRRAGIAAPTGFRGAGPERSRRVSGGAGIAGRPDRPTSVLSPARGGESKGKVNCIQLTS